MENSPKPDNKKQEPKKERTPKATTQKAKAKSPALRTDSAVKPSEGSDSTGAQNLTPAKGELPQGESAKIGGKSTTMAAKAAK